MFICRFCSKSPLLKNDLIHILCVSESTVKHYDVSLSLAILTLASEPLVGSVRQNAANFSPVATIGKYFTFCSSVPNSVMPLKPIDCTNALQQQTRISIVIFYLKQISQSLGISPRNLLTGNIALDSLLV